jgi:predicted lipoprotein with Yx(FWY)xxD motif
MKNKNLAIAILIGVIVIAGLVWLASRDANAPENNGTQNPPASVGPGAMKFAENEKLGKILTDGKGMTLYYFSKDVLGKSNCFGGCVTAWPLYNPASFTAPTGTIAADFTSVDRGDGTSQLAYKGWPLYYYFQDKNPGDTLGENVGEVWFVIPDPFYNVMIVNKEPHGNYLSDEKDMALYYFTNDAKGTATSSPVSKCAGQCLVNWPIFYAELETLAIPSTMDKNDFTEIRGTNGEEQLAYKGWPLYYYINDKNPGETNGQNVGDVWFLIKP